MRACLNCCGSVMLAIASGNESYIERLKLLKLPTLAYRRLRGDMIEVYKIMHELYDNESAPNLLKWEDVTLRSGNRRHSLKLFTQRAKINLRKNAFPLRVAEPWTISQTL